MKIKQLLCATATAAFTLAALPGEASAAVGYVCEAYFHHSSTMGNHGYVYVSAYTQPGCAGSWVTGATFCTTGGTASVCSASDLYTSAEVQALIQNLQRAAVARQKVNVVTTGTGSGVFVSFFST